MRTGSIAVFLMGTTLASGAITVTRYPLTGGSVCAEAQSVRQPHCGKQATDPDYQTARGHRTDTATERRRHPWRGQVAIGIDKWIEHKDGRGLFKAKLP